MGSRPKAPVIVTPTPTPEQQAKTEAALPPPAPQISPTAQRGNATNGPARMAAGFGMNNTILTSPRGAPAGTGTEQQRRGSLLGL